MTAFWMLSDGANPERIGSGLRSRIAIACPEFEWVSPPQALDSERFLSKFLARDAASARKIALLVSILGDAIAHVWPADQEDEGAVRASLAR